MSVSWVISTTIVIPNNKSEMAEEDGLTSSWSEWMDCRNPLLFYGHTNMFPPEQANLENHKREKTFLYKLSHSSLHYREWNKTFTVVHPLYIKKPVIMFRQCVSLNEHWPAIMKIIPPARATLPFCCGSSAKQVVHFMPTVDTKMAMKHSKMEDNISPRVPCTIPADQNHFIKAGLKLNL